MLCAPAKRRLLLLVGFLLFAVHTAAGQGLNLGVEQLGAGEAATASQFDAFQELLDLASQSTGGRGGKSRSSSSSFKTGAGFKSSRTLEQLQRSMYYIAGSPMAYSSYNTSQNIAGISLLPQVRDQLDCDTCVAQAIAAAIEAAIAAAWRKSAKHFPSVNAQSLYYCSEGGKTCKTGWDLQEALAAIMDKGQHLIRPTYCLKQLPPPLTKPEEEPHAFDWKPLCSEAAQVCSNVSSPDQPWLSCSYKSLSSFIDIQRHIRQHGAALTRITIYDDFEKHFNVTRQGGVPRATVFGASHKAYNRTKDSTSRPLFGHAAIIVGYDNTAFTWTLLNSWGKTRTTLDGMFKIAMGVGGVAVPDQTFGIECKPAPGGPDDLHSTDWLTPWIKDKTLKPRMPVEYWDRAKDWSNLDGNPCFKYSVRDGDSVPSLADAFSVDIRQLVRDNQALFARQTVNYTLTTGTAEDDVKRVVSLANKISVTDAGTEPPFLVCRIYTGQTWFSARTCRQPNLQPCFGAWGCKIVYREADVSTGLKPGTPVKVCGIPEAEGVFDRVAYLKHANDSQSRAIMILRQASGVVNFKLNIDRRSCPEHPFLRIEDTFPSLECSSDSMITSIEFGQPRDQPIDYNIPLSKPRVLYALMNLQKLSVLGINVGRAVGQLPRQLGALPLQRLWIASFCSSDTSRPLPDNWLMGGWRHTLVQLRIQSGDGRGKESRRGDPRCGVTGSIPGRWFKGTTALETLELPWNKLTGALPPGLSQSPNLTTLSFSHNSLSSTIPTTFLNLVKLQELELNSNLLSGSVPLGFSALKSLWFLSVGNNPAIEGCLPVDSSRTNVSYTNTQSTGICAQGAEQVWQKQLAAKDSLVRLFNASENSTGGQKEVWQEIMRLWAGLPSTTVAHFAQHPNAGTVEEFGQEWDMTTAFHGELSVVNGALYITSLNLEVNALVAPYQMQLQLLPDVLQRLPGLKEFHLNVYECSALPEDLALAAPASLARFQIYCWHGLSGTLPAAWGSWHTLQALSLSGGERLTGTLPASWSGMASLRTLDLSKNPSITGQIPASWWEQLGGVAIDLSGTSVELPSECPQGWMQASQNWKLPWSSKLLEACRGGEPGVLLGLKSALLKAYPSLQTSRLSTWVEDEASDAATGAQPAHCISWQGVACDVDRVTALDLSGLSSAVVLGVLPTSLQAVLEPLAGLPQLRVLKLDNNPGLFSSSAIPEVSSFSTDARSKLQHLGLSSCDLVGTIPSSLGQLTGLQHLNISSNPRITGTLPKALALTLLEVLDAAGCGGLSGSLPAVYGALPLQVLRVESRGIGGSLPAEFGMLQSLRELHIVDSAVAGSIPTAWFDPAEAVRLAIDAAAAAAAAAAASAAAESGDDSALVAAAWQRAANRASNGVAGSSATAAAAPAGNGLSMQQLEVLELSGNPGLAGLLPLQLAALRQLKVLDVSRGSLTGPLPDSYGQLGQLLQLDVSGNNLSGTLPEAWVGMHSLLLMDLSLNPGIGGALPELAFQLASPGRSLRCLRLGGTGERDGHAWEPDLATIQQSLECTAGSKLKVSIQSNTSSC